jgi:hypothetical protein
MVYKSSVRALGIINKMITGPFWRLIEKVGNVLEKMWKSERQPLLSRTHDL